MAFHQQARLFPDGERDRPEHLGHALAAQPVLRRLDQRGGRRGILGFEQAEIAGARPHALLGRHGERQLIDMRADPARDFVATPGEEILMLGMFVERVLARRQQAIHLVLEGRHPIGVIGVDRPGQVDKGLEIGLAGDGRNHNIGFGHGKALLLAPGWGMQC